MRTWRGATVPREILTASGDLSWRYGHLMPGNENEAAALLDAYLERANTRARLAAIED
ncbi:MAG: hypothetical protein ACRDMY_10865 [Gaiellaceae bacterium]